MTTKELWYFDKDWGTQEAQASLHPTKPDGTPVTFPDETGTERPVQWVYHVAPLIKVQQEDGSIQESVLDPSVSDRPLRISSRNTGWTATQLWRLYEETMRRVVEIEKSIGFWRLARCGAVGGLHSVQLASLGRCHGGGKHEGLAYQQGH